MARMVLSTISKSAPKAVSVTAASAVLFRFGERCNHACPMCTNTKRPEVWDIERAELLARADRIAAAGFRRAVVTGGEPTIHPDFFDVVMRLAEHGIRWDINTHGASFHRRDFADRSRKAGLERAIVSLHSHRPDIAAIMSGTPNTAFHRTVEGTRNLIAAGARTMLNLVISSHNASDLTAFLDFVADTFRPAPSVKFCFPSLRSQGKDWKPLQVTFRGVRDEVRRARKRADLLGLSLHFQSTPNCVTGDPEAVDLGRVGFGETHYLDDLDGTTLHALAYVDAAEQVYAETCTECAAFAVCPGVNRAYAARHGLDELEPFPRAWWAG